MDSIKIYESRLSEKRTIARIIKVNHAGEFGAIRIYKAQLLIANIFYKDIVSFLETTLQHEIGHCRKFREAMKSRDARPCYTMSLWSSGGYALGFVTGLCGRNLIMVCTEAVEDSVHRHLNDQLAFLRGRDENLKSIIEEIKVEELEHLHYAQSKVKHTGFTKAIGRAIEAVTEILIWLSTQGDVTRMKRDLNIQAIHGEH